MQTSPDRKVPKLVFELIPELSNKKRMEPEV